NKVAVSEGAAGSPPFYGELMNAVHQYKFPCFVLFSFERTNSQLDTVQVVCFFLRLRLQANSTMMDSSPHASREANSAQ
ncbi:hypothetical protein U2I54_29180, partial [Bacillus pseudomycoides]|nr:hypothetical protein [Bacillus pseudomycoides]